MTFFQTSSTCQNPLTNLQINYALSNSVNIKFFGMKSDRKLSEGGGSFERYIILGGVV